MSDCLHSPLNMHYQVQYYCLFVILFLSWQPNYYIDTVTQELLTDGTVDIPPPKTPSARVLFSLLLTVSIPFVSLFEWTWTTEPQQMVTSKMNTRRQIIDTKDLLRRILTCTFLLWLKLSPRGNSRELAEHYSYLHSTFNNTLTILSYHILLASGSLGYIHNFGDHQNWINQSINHQSQHTLFNKIYLQTTQSSWWIMPLETLPGKLNQVQYQFQFGSFLVCLSLFVRFFRLHWIHTIPYHTILYRSSTQINLHLLHNLPHLPNY